MHSRSYFYNLRFAGMLFRILAPRPLCLPENLRPFLIGEPTEQEPDWVIEVIFGSQGITYGQNDHVTRFPRKDGEGFLRVVPADSRGICRLFVPDDIADKFCINANWMLFLMMERLLLPYDRIILHSSAVIHEGKAILFTAPSGIGKSTQASLWESYLGAEVINGDKVIVSADGDKPIAYGGPIAGTSHIFRDLQAPIGAIVYLRQGKNNELTFLDQRHAFMALYSQTVKSRDDREFNQALLPLIASIVEKVPVIDYFCRPDFSAVDYLRSQLK